MLTLTGPNYRTIVYNYHCSIANIHTQTTSHWFNCLMQMCALNFSFHGLDCESFEKKSEMNVKERERERVEADWVNEQHWASSPSVFLTDWHCLLFFPSSLSCASNGRAKWVSAINAVQYTRAHAHCARQLAAPLFFLPALFSISISTSKSNRKRLQLS